MPEIVFLSQTPKNVRTSDTTSEVIIWGKEGNQKKKISGCGATVKGKWLYYDVLNVLEYYFQRRTTEIFQIQQLQMKFH